MTTSRTHRIKIEGPGHIELGELRWFISQLEGAPDNAKVRVDYLAGSPRESDSCSLSADVPDIKINQKLINQSHIPGARGGSASRPIKDRPQA